MDGLENWDEKELERRGVKDLASEMAAAEKLKRLSEVDSPHNLSSFFPSNTIFLTFASI